MKITIKVPFGQANPSELRPLKAAIFGCIDGKKVVCVKARGTQVVFQTFVEGGTKKAHTHVLMSGLEHSLACFFGGR